MDPLSQVIALLRPRTVFTKPISAAGRWAVRYAAFGQPSFCTVLDGACRLRVDGQAPLTLSTGDFLLLPTTPGFTMSGFEPATPLRLDPKGASAPPPEVRHGDPEGPPDVRLLGGYFAFDSPDAALLAALLPTVVHVHGERAGRLAQLTGFVRDETRSQRPGRDLVLARLVEVLLVEALRSWSTEDAEPGLLRGMADPRLAPALGALHGDIGARWTVASLARASALSRSAFFVRFERAMGLPPMRYVTTVRMATAKRLLRDEDLDAAEVAERVGYASASAFSTAFSREVGLPPGQWARAARVASTSQEAAGR